MRFPAKGYATSLRKRGFMNEWQRGSYGHFAFQSWQRRRMRRNLRPSPGTRGVPMSEVSDEDDSVRSEASDLGGEGQYQRPSPRTRTKVMFFHEGGPTGLYAREAEVGFPQELILYHKQAFVEQLQSQQVRLFEHGEVIQEHLQDMLVETNLFSQQLLSLGIPIPMFFSAQ